MPCCSVGSLTGQILEFNENESDMERLASELDNRLCVEAANDSDGDADVDDDDDDDDDANFPSQVSFLDHVNFC